jgi:hypothetical protein
VKRLLAAVALVGVAVLVGVLTASGSSKSTAKSAAPAKKSVTFHLVEKSVGFNFIDNPPHQGFNSPPLSGDQFAITSNLLTKGGAHAGTLEATCTITRGGENQRGTCYGVFALKGGQLSGIALLTTSDVTRISVTGGTGVYEGVSGSVISVNKENTPFADDTVHLIWP